jgi:hypothetical protein
MQKWEYCRLAIGGRYGGNLVLQVMCSADGYKDTEYRPDKTTTDRNSGEILDRLAGRLGSEGWEMVGAVMVGGGNLTLYFKRPLP